MFAKRLTALKKDKRGKKFGERSIIRGPTHCLPTQIELRVSWDEIARTTRKTEWAEIDKNPVKGI